MIEKEKERIDDEGIDLLNLLLNLWNHKLLILVLACIAALFMFVKTAFSQILPILLICDEYGVLLFEDAAESFGATYKGKQTGTFGKYGIFSFNGNKIITTSGGGMLVSDDEERLKKVLY